jgi:hypothetical protein
MKQRILAGKTISFDRRDLPAISGILDRAMNDVSRIVSRAKRVDALYQVNMQVFDLEAPKKEKRHGKK